MDHVLLLLALLALVKSIWATSLWPGRWGSIVFGGVCGIFIGSTHVYVLGLGKAYVDRWISGYSSLLDLSLWVMMDLLLTAALCWGVMQRWFGVVLRKREKWMLYCPSVVLFPALMYLHICLFYLFPGMDFEWGTTVYAVSVFFCVVGGCWGIKNIVPEINFRLEITALLALLLFGVTVGCTIFHPSVRIEIIPKSTDWQQALEVIGVLMVLPFVGFVLRQLWYFNKKKFRI